MKIAFVSNYINHHQLPLSDKLYELSGGNYTFIQTEPMAEERVKMGWDAGASNTSYVRFYYEEKEICDRIIMESDCVIFGGCEDEDVIMPRLEAGLFTIRYMERIYKSGRWKFVSPKGLKKKYHDHIRFKDSPVWLLCAGAYVKGDFELIHAYKDKMFKFGYFPKFEHYENVHEFRNMDETLEILWTARFIDWKHAEIMPSIATGLKLAGIKAHITMIGDGELLTSVKEDAIKRGLTEKEISFEGSKTPDEVRKAMLRANVFVSTSDRLEGWGAVVNEAMNSGCVTIAAREIGAAPYLIKDRKNGFVYGACHKEELLRKILYVASDRANALNIGSRAYETIRDVWNANTAAERLYGFIASGGKMISSYDDGPMSRA